MALLVLQLAHRFAHTSVHVIRFGADSFVAQGFTASAPSHLIKERSAPRSDLHVKDQAMDLTGFTIGTLAAMLA